MFAGGLSPSDLLRKQPRWERIAEYTQRWSEALDRTPPSSPSEQAKPRRSLYQGSRERVFFLTCSTPSSTSYSMITQRRAGTVLGTFFPAAQLPSLDTAQTHVLAYAT